MRPLLPLATILAAVLLPGCIGARKTSSGTSCDPSPPGPHVLTRDRMRSLGDMPFVDVMRHVPGVVIQSGRLVVRGDAVPYAQKHPLIFVDGIHYAERIVDISYRSTDLFTVQVLLSASEQSQYGAQGGAGVILVSTRRAGCN